MNKTSNTPVTGTTANGVPFLATRPSRPDAPVVVAWHLLDPPRTETAMSAALPLTGLDAWKIYLGLPLSGPRMPAGGIDEVMRLGMEDAVMNLHWPIHEQAVAEFPAAFAELCERLGIAEDAEIGLLGGSAGSSIAAGVLAEGDSGAKAAVFVSPMLRLKSMVDVLSEFFGVDYRWSAESDHAAERMDFVARAPELVATGAALRVIAGADDSAGATEPAREFAAATGADLTVLDGVAHALAEEPGIDAAPQTAGAKQVDELAVEWFRAQFGATVR
jgi:pimeloyl-ACP methyl ester carboxylesterase